MRRRIHKLSGSILMVLVSAFIPAGAQTFGIGNGARTEQYLNWQNAWFGSANPAAISLFSTASVSAQMGEAVAGGDCSFGKFRTPYEPASRFGANLSTLSYIKLWKAVAKGRFGYGYDLSKGSTWRGLADPHETPFMLADSIPGNLSKETYSMEAAVAMPVGSHLSLGLEAAYDVALMAKHVDLRNKNTGMDFHISPGIRYDSRHFSAGLSARYHRSTEKIEYLQVDESTEKYLFEFMGAWNFRSLGFSSAETSRMKIGNAFGGSLQTEYKSGGKFRIFNEFSADYLTTSQGETGYNGLRHGDSRSLVIADNISFVISPRRRITAYWKSAPMVGYRFIQRQELDPASGIRRYVTYGSPVPCFDRMEYEGGLYYDAPETCVDNDRTFTIRLACGLEFGHMEEYYSEGIVRQSGVAYNYMGPALKILAGWQSQDGRNKIDMGIQANSNFRIPMKKADLVYYDEMSMIQFTGNHYDGELADRQAAVMNGLAFRAYAQWTHQRLALRLNGRLRAPFKAAQGTYTTLSLTAAWSF
ncbi:MAG: hypothetical protein HUJ94_02135 [Bacteroidales bacterium]|nr:hypothetical protein [Bacteroidales bacterium]